MEIKGFKNFLFENAIKKNRNVFCKKIIILNKKTT